MQNDQKLTIEPGEPLYDIFNGINKLNVWSI